MVGASRLARHAVAPQQRRSDARDDDKYSPILRLQRQAGNAAVSSLINELRVQRAPDGPVRGKDYEEWSPGKEASKVKADLTRDTKLVASRWWEVAPGPLRVEYKQDATLHTRDRRRGGVTVDLTVFLDPAGALPRSRGAAVAAPGVRTSGGWDSWADGDGYDEMSHRGSLAGRSGQSLQDLAEEFPDFARLYLPAREQEAALLRYVDRLKAANVEPPVSTSKSTVAETVKDAADVITDFVPVVSNVKDFYTFLFGKTVRGQKVGWVDRLIALITAIPGFGNLTKYILKGARWVGRELLGPLLKWLTKGFPDASKRLKRNTALMARGDDAAARKAVTELEAEADGIVEKALGPGGKSVAEDAVEAALPRRPRDAEELVDGLRELQRRGGSTGDAATRWLDAIGEQGIERIRRIAKEREALRDWLHRHRQRKGGLPKP